MHESMSTIVHSPAEVGAVARERRKALGYTQAQIASLCSKGVFSSRTSRMAK